MEGKAQISIDIDDEIYEQIESIAERNGTTVEDLVQNIIEEYVVSYDEDSFDENDSDYDNDCDY